MVIKMKRLFVAAAILLSVIILCIFTLNLQSKNINFLINIIDEMQQSYDQKDLGKCIEVSHHFKEEFDAKTRFFPFFMRHSDVSKIEDTAVTLPTMLEANDTDHFIVELTKCRSQLEELAKLETPTLENIF